MPTKRSLVLKKWQPRFASEAIIMRRKLLAGLALAAGVLIMSVPLFAHHGNAAFDTSKKLTLKGTVTEWVWANPHCWLKFDVKNDKGEVTHWPCSPPCTQSNSPVAASSAITERRVPAVA